MIHGAGSAFCKHEAFFLGWSDSFVVKSPFSNPILSPGRSQKARTFSEAKDIFPQVVLSSLALDAGKEGYGWP